MELSTPNLQVVIHAVQDAIELTKSQIDRSEADVTDLEHYLYELATLEVELKAEYLKLSQQNPSIIPYDVLVGARRFRKL